MRWLLSIFWSIYNEKPATVVPLASCGKLAACGMDVDGKDGVVILGGKSIKHTIQRMEEKRLVIWRKTNRAQNQEEANWPGQPSLVLVASCFLRRSLCWLWLHPNVWSGKPTLQLACVSGCREIWNMKFLARAEYYIYNLHVVTVICKTDLSCKLQYNT